VRVIPVPAWMLKLGNKHLKTKNFSVYRIINIKKNIQF